MAKRKRGAPPEPRKVTIVRYEAADGKRCAKSTPGAIKRVEESDTWYAYLVPPEGGKPRPVSLGTTDHGLAWEELKKLLRGAELKRLGLDPKEIEQAERSFAEQVEEWAGEVRDSGTSSKQVGTLRADVLALAELAGWRKVADIDEGSTLKALSKLLTTPGRGASKRYGSRSAQTRNHYLKHLKQFTRWLASARRRRLPADPIADLKTISVESDRRHDRRAPTDEEMARLFESLAREDAAVRCEMTGPQRALAYKVAMATGFRALEVRSLSRLSFNLEAATATVRAGYSKRRRSDVQGLPPWLIVELREWFEAHPTGQPWEGFHPDWPGRLLKEDLAVAGVPYEVPGPDGPLFFDFHALRHWFCTWAANLPGISPRTLLALTRHSSTELALKTYAKVQQASVRKAVEGLPGPMRADKPASPAGPKSSPPEE